MSTLNKDQAIRQAQQIIELGYEVVEADRKEQEAFCRGARDSSDCSQRKEEALLNYRVMTTPDRLERILETLIANAEKAGK